MIAQILTIIIFIAFAFASFMFGMHIKDAGADTINFCSEHYDNDSFLKTTTYYTEDDPAEPMQCQSSQWRTGWYQLCNDSCFESVDKCYKENATEDQVRFMHSCHWMGPDYWITFGTLMFGFFIPCIVFILTGTFIAGYSSEVIM